MVIDVDDEEALEPGDAGARQVAALHDDRGVEVAVDLGRRSRCPATPGNAISGAGAGSALTTVDLLAERPQRVGHRQLRADRVAVGPRVRGEHEALPRADRVDDLLESQDWSSSSSCRDVVGVGGVAGADLVQELLDAVLAGDRLVVDELELGRRASAAAATPICRRRNGDRALERARRSLRAFSSPSAV